MAEQIARADLTRHLLERDTDVALRGDERRNLSLGADGIRKPAHRDRDDHGEQADGNK